MAESVEAPPVNNAGGPLEDKYEPHPVLAVAVACSNHKCRLNLQDCMTGADGSPESGGTNVVVNVSTSRTDARPATQRCVRI